jgi:hypothetical protein
VESLELEIAEWRSFVGQAAAVDGADLEELESHLREQMRCSGTCSGRGGVARRCPRM